MDLNPKFFPGTLEMSSAFIVKNEEKALISPDSRGIALIRIIDPVTVHIVERGEYCCLTQRNITVAGPYKDVIYWFISRIIPVMYMIIDVSLLQIPDIIPGCILLS